MLQSENLKSQPDLKGCHQCPDLIAGYDLWIFQQLVTLLLLFLAQVYPNEYKEDQFCTYFGFS